MVTTVRPNASETPSRPMPTSGNAAARTALPQPPNTSQNVPINSAKPFWIFVILTLLPAGGLRRLRREGHPISAASPGKPLRARDESGHGNRFDEVPRTLVQRKRRLGQPGRQSAQRLRTVADGGRAMPDLADAPVDLAPCEDRLLDIGCDHQRRRALPVDGIVDRAGKAVVRIDRLFNLLETRGDLADDVADAVDILGDVARRRPRLVGEQLHLRRDDRKAAPGVARPRRLDPGVQREQVGSRLPVGGFGWPLLVSTGSPAF